MREAQVHEPGGSPSSQLCNRHRSPAESVLKPFSTPSIMLAIRVRVRPCSALCSGWSSGRLTGSQYPPAQVHILVHGVRSVHPFRALDGNHIAFADDNFDASRDSNRHSTNSRHFQLPPLPNKCQDFAADMSCASLLVGHDALRSGDDSNTRRAGQRAVPQRRRKHAGRAWTHGAGR